MKPSYIQILTISILIFTISSKKIPFTDAFTITENFKDQNTEEEEELIDISSGYTHVDPNDSIYFYIAVIATSDVHGHFYPEELEIGNLTYTRGGLDYVSKYINILRNEFPNRVLYLDAGDLFQGGTESTLTNGEIMNDYYNVIEANGVTFGNHEYDYSRSFIENKVSEANFPYMATNIYDTKKETKNAFGENHITSKIFSFNITNTNQNNNRVDQIKIGIVGLSKEMTKQEISGSGYDDIVFLNYKNELTAEAKKLREEDKVHSVILLAHIGIGCGNEDVLDLNMYTKQTKQNYCNSDSELYILLNSLDEGVIDAVITGHSHREVHHWINNIPVISPIDAGLYANILYLPFKWNTWSQYYFLFKNRIAIEGPLPICEKIFKSSKNCEFVKESQLDKYLPLVSYKFHGVKIEKDPVLQPIHDKYDEEYEIYRTKIATIIGTEDELEVLTNGDFYLGNIIVDINRKVTGADLSVLGYGGLRTTWKPGRITKASVKDLLPFNNTLCTFSMTGDEVRKMMEILQTGYKAYYPTSGLKQILNKNSKGEIYLSDVKLFDGYMESELFPEKEYLVAMIDYYILKGGDDFYKIREWYEPRNLNCDFGYHPVIVENYLKAQGIIDVRQYKDDNNPRIKKLF